MVLMIIKGLFRRYERWNPVHPSYGAFWGMGIGLGCGVGWGPGFGPEVVGYVGAGCGVGFSVGITLAGFGVGLPANWLLLVPYNAVIATRKAALDLSARSNSLLFSKNVAGDGWSNVLPQIAAFQRQARANFCGFKQRPFLDKGIDLIAIQNTPRNISKGFGRFVDCFFRPNKGLKD